MEFNAIIHSIPIIDYNVVEFTTCQVSGWGSNEWQGVMPSDLYKANVTIVNRAVCNYSYADIITEGMVCANGLTDDGVVDVCQGGRNVSPPVNKIIQLINFEILVVR